MATTSRKTPSMRLVPKRVADLLADPRNARTHDERNVELIRYSLRKFGQQKNVVIGTDDVMIAGSGTLEAAHREGWEWLDCKVWTGTIEEARAYGIIDNRSGELAAWDPPQLAETITDLPPELAVDVGFTDEEIAHLLDDGGDTEPEFGDHGADGGEQAYGVIVMCGSEHQQRDLMERLDQEGFDVRAMIT